MKRLLLLVLAICIVATPALAARTVYLKAGGTISARSVWRSKGQVHVLVNRDTLTEFSTNEIDLKRTFPRSHRRVKRATPAAHLPQAAAAAERVAESSASAQTTGSATTRFALPSLPKLSGRNPEQLIPTGGNDGTIRKHKKEMAERLGE